MGWSGSSSGNRRRALIFQHREVAVGDVRAENCRGRHGHPRGGRGGCKSPTAPQQHPPTHRAPAAPRVQNTRHTFTLERHFFYIRCAKGNSSPALFLLPELLRRSLRAVEAPSLPHKASSECFHPPPTAELGHLPPEKLPQPPPRVSPGEGPPQPPPPAGAQNRNLLLPVFKLKRDASTVRDSSLGVWLVKRTRV